MYMYIIILHTSYNLCNVYCNARNQNLTTFQVTAEDPTFEGKDSNWPCMYIHRPTAACAICVTFAGVGSMYVCMYLEDICKYTLT